MRTYAAAVMWLAACGSSTSAPAPALAPSAPAPVVVQVSGPPALDDALVAEVAARPEVAAVTPRVRLDVPAKGRGIWQQNQLAFEVGGFSDGIDPAFAAGDAKIADRFLDWDARGGLRPACTDACTDPDHYCDAGDHTCHHRVPAIVSPLLLDQYNTRFAAAHDLTPIGDPAPVIASGATRFELVLGESMVAPTGTGGATPPRTVGVVVVAVSPRATAIGLTFPDRYVRRWNQLYNGAPVRPRYSALVVTIRDGSQLAGFSAWIRARGLDVGPP